MCQSSHSWGCSSTYPRCCANASQISTPTPFIVKGRPSSETLNHVPGPAQATETHASCLAACCRPAQRALAEALPPPGRDARLWKFISTGGSEWLLPAEQSGEPPQKTLQVEARAGAMKDDDGTRGDRPPSAVDTRREGPDLNAAPTAAPRASARRPPPASPQDVALPSGRAGAGGEVGEPPQGQSPAAASPAGRRGEAAAAAGPWGCSPEPPETCRPPAGGGGAWLAGKWAAGLAAAMSRSRSRATPPPPSKAEGGDGFRVPPAAPFLPRRSAASSLASSAQI